MCRRGGGGVRIPFSWGVNSNVGTRVSRVLAKCIGGPSGSSDEAGSVLQAGALYAETTTTEERKTGGVEPGGDAEQFLLNLLSRRETIGDNVVEDDDLGSGGVGGRRGKIGGRGAGGVGIVRQVIPRTVPRW